LYDSVYNRVALNEDLARALLAFRVSLSPPRLAGGLLEQELVDEYLRVMASLPGTEQLLEAVDTCLDSEHGDGYLVLGCQEIVESCELEDALRLLTVLLTVIATPLRAFDRWDLWKPLGTNLTIDPMRATGTGYNPLHLDVVNATEPPDFSVLLCVRADPRGEGYSVVSNLHRALERLPLEQVDLLRDAVYTDGEFFDLTGVGEEYSPFPILDGLPPGGSFVRFTAKMLAERDPDDPHTRAARAFERELIAGQHRFLLGRGDLIVVNQRLACHGREALGPGQAEIPESARRLLHQMFLRRHAETTTHRRTLTTRTPTR
jgi:hypothetical protein